MLQEYLRRIGLLLVGLLVSAIGITLMLQANIGLEPWSVLQQGIAKTFGITYGTAASIVGAAVIAIAYFCGESFGLGTLANIFVCPIFIDILLYLNWIPLFERFSTSLAALLIGMELLALGTWMYMKSTLGSGPRDALMVVLARKTHRTVGLDGFDDERGHDRTDAHAGRRCENQLVPKCFICQEKYTEIGRAHV